MGFTTTWGSASNALASTSLLGSGSVSFTLDYSSVSEGRLMVENTPGGTVSTVRGLRVRSYQQRGPSGSAVYATFPYHDDILPSAAASTREAKVYYFPPGKWNVTLTNVDATYNTGVQATSDTIT